MTVVRSLSGMVRPGGVLAFHEPTWAPFLQFTAHLPLSSACASLIHKTFQRSEAKTDMGLTLYRTFLEAGLPSPSMRMELPIGDDPDFTLWLYDLLCSLRPQMLHHDLTDAMLGDLDTLLARLQAEFAAAKTFGACVGLVGAWSRRP